MNALSVAVLLLGIILPIAGLVFSLQLSTSHTTLVAQIAVGLPIVSWAVGSLLMQLSALVAGHPEWNSDTSSHPMGVMAAVIIFYTVIMIIPVMVCTVLALDSAERNKTEQPLAG